MIDSWVKGLVIYLILSGLVMKLVPGKSYERYISFYIGLILVFMLAKPVLLFLNKDNKGVERVINAVDGYLRFDSSDEVSEFMNDRDTYFEMSLNEGITEKCKNAGLFVSGVKVITDDAGRILRVTLFTDKDTDENNIKKIIYDVYKVDYESIYIVRR